MTKNFLEKIESIDKEIEELKSQRKDVQAEYCENLLFQGEKPEWPIFILDRSISITDDSKTVYSPDEYPKTIIRLSGEKSNVGEYWGDVFRIFSDGTVNGKNTTRAVYEMRGNSSKYSYDIIAYENALKVGKHIRITSTGINGLASAVLNLGLSESIQSVEFSLTDEVKFELKNGEDDSIKLKGVGADDYIEAQLLKKKAVELEKSAYVYNKIGVKLELGKFYQIEYTPEGESTTTCIGRYISDIDIENNTITTEEGFWSYEKSPITIPIDSIFRVNISGSSLEEEANWTVVKAIDKSVLDEKIEEFSKLLNNSINSTYANSILPSAIFNKAEWQKEDARVDAIINDYLSANEERINTMTALEFSREKDNIIMEVVNAARPRVIKFVKGLSDNYQFNIVPQENDGKVEWQIGEYFEGEPQTETYLLKESKNNPKELVRVLNGRGVKDDPLADLLNDDISGEELQTALEDALVDARVFKTDKLCLIPTKTSKPGGERNSGLAAVKDKAKGYVFYMINCYEDYLDFDEIDISVDNIKGLIDEVNRAKEELNKD